MNKKRYCIYRVKNNINNKTYIGQHSYYGENPLRTKGNKIYRGSGKLLKEAYKKYGIENFSYEIIIKDIESKKEIDELEKFYINKERNHKGEKNIYNISKGGTGGIIWDGDSPTFGKKAFNNGIIQIYSEKCPDGFKEGVLFTMSEERKKIISESHKGNKNPMYGKKWYHTLSGEEKLISTEELKNYREWIPGQ